MAVAAKRLVEMYLYIDQSRPTVVNVDALNLIHHGMAQALREKLYNSCECFLPTQISAKFGKRLERTWGWIRNWPSWTIKF